MLWNHARHFEQHCHSTTLSSGRNVKLNCNFHLERRIEVSGFLRHFSVGLMFHGTVLKLTDSYRSFLRWCRAGCNAHYRLFISCPTVQFAERFWLPYFALYRSFGLVIYVDPDSVSLHKYPTLKLGSNCLNEVKSLCVTAKQGNVFVSLAFGTLRVQCIVARFYTRWTSWHYHLK
jgi:hypothetical protein